MTTQLELSEIKRRWIDDAAKQIRILPGLKFSADDLHKYLPAAPHDGYWGCLIAKLRCAGNILEIGRVRSSRPERNGAKIGLYEVV